MVQFCGFTIVEVGEEMQRVKSLPGNLPPEERSIEIGWGGKEIFF